MELTDTVLEVKEKLVSGSSVPAAQQRLIYKGRILKDSSTLDEYAVADGQTVHLVRGAAPAGSTPAPAPAAAAPAPAHGSSPTGAAVPPALGATGDANPFAAMMGGGMPGMGGMPTPETMQQMMESPMVQQMMSSLMDNPEVMQQMMSSNPAMAAVLDANPQLREAMSDPETMRQMMAAQRNPALMAEMMRQQDRAMANIEAHPQGHAALARMFHEVQRPLEEAQREAANPWATGGSGGSGGSTPQAASAPAAHTLRCALHCTSAG